MLLPRRLAAAAPRQLSRRAQSISSLSRTCRPYSSEAASAATQEAVDEPTTTPAKTKTATSATTTTSKWAKPKTAAKTSAATLSTSAASKRTTAALPSDVLYQPKTIAHTATSDVAPQEAVGVPVIDWANSFHGISSKPVTEEQFKVLMQPINEKDIEVKPDGVIYLPEIKYRRRLNEAFGPMGWGMIPKGEPVVGNTIVTREYALIVGGRFVSQAQGENGFFSPDQLPSAVEGCKSNALMRCCKDLGIGSELWDPHFVRWFKKTRMEEVWVEHTTTKKKRTFWYRKGEVDVAYPYKLAK